MKRLFFLWTVLMVAFSLAAQSSLDIYYPDKNSQNSQNNQNNQAQQKQYFKSKSSYLQRYYDRNGRSSVSWVSAAYSTYFLYPTPEGLTSTTYAFKQHLITMEILEWRAGIIGMSFFQFEMGQPFQKGDLTNTVTGKTEADGKTMWFAYKPGVKIYIPLGKYVALQLAGGVELDITKIWSGISKKYTYNPDNWFMDAYGGVGLYFTPIPQIPIELKAEYRHPVMGNKLLMPQGFYITAQVHLTKRIVW